MKRAAGDNQPVQRFFLGDGSYLRYKGRSVMESLSKLTACWAPGDSLEILSDNTSAPLQIATEAPPRSVKWNGHPVTGRYDGQSGLVSMRI
jgi:hypothetical protein